VGQPSGLQDGEVVFTVDDGPGSHSEAMAEALAQSGASATFFVVANHFGRSERLEPGPGDALTLLPGGLKPLAAILDRGHAIANHTYSHPNLQTLTDARLRAEVVDAHRLMEMAVTKLGYSPSSHHHLLRFYRSPGNHWLPRLASLLNIQALARYRGPVGWDVPAPQDEDFRCWKRCAAQGIGSSKCVNDCAYLYLSRFRQLPRGQQRAIFLLHELHPESVKLAQRLLLELRKESQQGTRAGNCIRVVPLRCVVGCTRTAADLTCLHER